MKYRGLLIAFAVLLVAASVLGLYVFHLARRARAAAPATASDAEPVAPPVAGPATPVTVYAASDEDSLLHRRETAIALSPEPAQRARQVLHALVAQYQDPGSAHPLGAGADINDVYLVEETLAVVDVNAVFADTHPSGILEEELTLASLTQTLAANIPGVTAMKLLVDGKERATLAGHVGLAEPYAARDAARIVAPASPAGSSPSGPAAESPGVQARLGSLKR
jgi:hypothetical protein